MTLANVNQMLQPERGRLILTVRTRCGPRDRVSRIGGRCVATYLDARGFKPLSTDVTRGFRVVLPWKREEHDAFGHD